MYRSRHETHNAWIKIFVVVVFNVIVSIMGETAKKMTRCHYIICFIWNLILMTATKSCYSWNFNSFDPQCRHRSRHQQQQQQQQAEIGDTRRQVIYKSIIMGCATFQLLPATANAYDDDDNNGNGNNNKISMTSNTIITVRIESPADSLGVEVYDTKLRGKNIVAIRRVVVPNKKNKYLRDGMVLLTNNKTSNDNSNSNGIVFSSISSKQLVEKLQYGPYPIELNFFNLAAGGDAISDLGSSIVTPKDALELAQSTDDDDNNVNKQTTAQQQQQQQYIITTTTQRQSQQSCAMQSRRNDVLEINYEAAYVDKTGERKVIYDASAFRGTGNRPYQMVLGSGDMIPGVDQGLYDMCPGEERILNIPPILGHGPKSRKLYLIPSDYMKLEWKIKLVSIDANIREDNNIVSRDERESRFAY
jgi:FK506-binding protein 2